MIDIAAIHSQALTALPPAMPGGFRAGGLREGVGMPIYIYAIVPQGGGNPLPSGIAAAPVYAIAAGGLAAVVSDYAAPTIRPERKHLAAAQAVLKALQAHGDMLPVA